MQVNKTGSKILVMLGVSFQQWIWVLYLQIASLCLLTMAVISLVCLSAERLLRYARNDGCDCGLDLLKDCFVVPPRNDVFPVKNCFAMLSKTLRVAMTLLFNVIANDRRECGNLFFVKFLT